MGEHGFLRQPGSVRDLRENGGKPTELPAPERPIFPPGFQRSLRKSFDYLVDLAIASGIPTKPSDGPMFATAAQVQLDYQKADASNRPRIFRDLEKAYDACGLSVKSRFRMGLKGVKKQESRASKLVNMAKAVNGS